MFFVFAMLLPLGAFAAATGRKRMHYVRATPLVHSTMRSDRCVCCQVVQAIAIALAVLGAAFSIVYDINSDPNYAASAHGVLGFVLVALVVVCLCWPCPVHA
jgi:FtsH-binding integral membrane protein